MKLPVLLLLPALLVGGRMVLPPGVPPPAAGQDVVEVPRKESARAQLEYAARRKRELHGRGGEARRRARAQAVAAYRAVRVHFPRERTLGAEATFRAGELLRAGGAAVEALEEFTAARRLGERTEFEARAGLEIGHLHRRGRRHMEALTAYERILADGDSGNRHRDRASYWAGRVHEELERPGDARRCYERVARRGADPVDRIRAFDAWTSSLIDQSDLEGAAGVLELCRSSLRDVALEETALGERVREALERMRSVGRLAREVEERLRRRLEEDSAGAGDGRPIPPRNTPRPRFACACPGARFPPGFD